VSRPDPSGAIWSDAEHPARYRKLQRDWVGTEWAVAGLVVARGKVAEYQADGVVAELLADARVHHDLGSGHVASHLL
jgi:hypothetical protein